MAFGISSWLLQIYLHAVYYLNRFPLRVHPLSPFLPPLPPMRPPFWKEERKKERGNPPPLKFHHFTPLGVLFHVTFSKKNLGKREEKHLFPLPSG